MKKQKLSKQEKKAVAIRNAVLGELALAQKHNLINLADVTRTEVYEDVFDYLDRAENNGFVTVDGLPFHSYEITNLLYERPMLGFIRNEFGLLDIVDVVPKSWASMGRVNQCTVIQPFRDNSAIPPNKVYTNHVDIVILYDVTQCGYGHSSRESLTRQIRKDMSKNIARLAQNLKLAGSRLIFSGVDIDNQEQFKLQLEKMFSEGNVFTVYEYLVGQKVEDINPTTAFAELWSNLKQYDMLRQKVHGIENLGVGNVKDSGMQTLEIEDNNNATNLVAAARQQLWKEWAKEMATVFGVTVQLTFNGGKI